MDIELLVKLTAKAWSLTILQSLKTGVPGRQAPLLAASGAGRTAFSQSLAHLIDLALLERNPGHGHPLRPEFRLTALGRQAAGLAAAIFDAAPTPADRALLRRRWTVPIMASLFGPRHFGGL
ncbi:MAG: transcriptional regulator, partial [Pseudomonadota bacterium]